MSQIVQRCMSLDEDVFITLDNLEEVKGELIQALAERDVLALILDKAMIFDVDTLLHAFYQNCEFPSYFGFNWNALDECLNDFHWKRAKGYVLIYRKPLPLRKSSPRDWDILVDVFKSANKEWLKDHIPFKVIFPEDVANSNT